MIQEIINFLNTYIKAHGCTEMNKWVEFLEQLGWHSANELPPVDKIGESEYLIVYDLNGYAFSAFYSRKRGWCDEDGRDNLKIEWWCNPPKNE